MISPSVCITKQEATATDDSITASPEYQTAKKVMDEVEHTQSISLE